MSVEKKTGHKHYSDEVLKTRNMIPLKPQIIFTT
jgi:hypothetical protein